MSEECKTCRKEFISGIWLAPQFIDEKVLLFCSDKCKNQHIKEKLDRIKGNYPGFYNKIMKSLKEGKRDKAIDQKLLDMILQSGEIRGELGNKGKEELSDDDKKFLEREIIRKELGPEGEE